MQLLQRAADVLNLFEDESECLRLTELTERTSMSKTTVHRLCGTLVNVGMLRRVGKHGYRLAIRPLSGRRFRVGYGAQNGSDRFSQKVTESIRRCAVAADIDLLILDNEDSSSRALENTETFIREKVDLVLSFQTDISIAQRIADRLEASAIPAVAMEVPQPGAVFFGANNVQAGLMAGRHLAQWAKSNWEGATYEIVLLDLPKAGHIPNARIQAGLLGIIESLAWVSPTQIKILHTIGSYESAHAAVRRHLSRSGAKRILMITINDACSLGALQAFRDYDREDHCAIVTHNFDEGDCSLEISRPESRLIGAIAYFPERYGEAVIPLITSILRGFQVPRINFIAHEVITHENINAYKLSYQTKRLR
jgi:ribose transport system substrate-binding protein